MEELEDVATVDLVNEIAEQKNSFSTDSNNELVNRLENFIKAEKANVISFPEYRDIKASVLGILKSHNIMPNTANELLTHIVSYYNLEQAFHRFEQ